MLFFLDRSERINCGIHCYRRAVSLRSHTCNMDVVATVAAAIDWPTVLAYIFTVMAAYVALTVAAVASPLARRILFKSRLYARGIAHMALSREKKGWPKARGNGGARLGVNTHFRKFDSKFVRRGKERKLSKNLPCRPKICRSVYDLSLIHI